MKRIYLLLLAFITTTVIYSEELSYSIHMSSAGTLFDELTTAGNLTTITHLTVTGNIDARDFKTMHRSMTALTNIDLSGAEILAYSGTEGSILSTDYTYPENAIPTQSFQYSYRLKQIILPSSTVTIGANSFERCNGLTEINIPPSVKTIQSCAFSRCAHISSIHISKDVVSIGSNAFESFYGNIDVDAENPNYSSMDGMLYNKLKTILIQCPTSKGGIVTIPDGVEVLGEWCFADCVDIAEIIIPNSVTEIDRYAFYSCEGLSNLFIPASVNIINSNPIFYSPTLIEVDENNIYYSSLDGILYNKAKTSLLACSTAMTGVLTIPSTVTSIGYNSLLRNSLTEIVFPDGFLNFASHALGNGSNLKKINLPASTKTIPNYTMYQASSVECIVSDITNPSNVILGTYSLDVNKSKCYLFVPAGTKAAYQAAPIWNDFVNIIEGTGFGLASALTISPKAGTSSFNIYSNTTCVITKNDEASWLQLDQSDISGNATVTITAEANATTTSRVATITVSANGEEKQMIVTQSAPYVYLSNSNYSFDASDSDPKCCTINSNVNWVASTDNSWIHYNIQAKDVNITVDENLLTSARSGVVNISAPGLSKSITIYQRGVPVILDVSTLSLNLANEIGSTVTFSITSNINWSIGHPGSLSVSPQQGSGDGEVTLTAESKNNSTSPKTYTIWVQGTGATSKYIEITQAGISSGVDDNNRIYLTIYPNPTTDGFNIGNLDKSCLLTISDMTGQMLISKEVANNDFVDTRSLSSGTYVVTVLNSKMKLIVK